VFLRPHDVVVDIQPDGVGVSAKVSRVVHLGWEIDVQLRLDDGHEVKAILSREQYDKLALKPEQRVFVKPKAARAFAHTSDVVGANI
jgi:sulfate transport system ATP-binding protein